MKTEKAKNKVCFAHFRAQVDSAAITSSPRAAHLRKLACFYAIGKIIITFFIPVPERGLSYSVKKELP